MFERIKSYLLRSQDISWALALLLLPITSVPILVRLTGASTVAPLSILPLVWLALAWFLPYIIKGGTLPRHTVPLLAFVLVTVIASAGAFFIDMPPYRGKNLLSQEIQAFMTFAVGIGSYLIAAAWLQTSARLQTAYKLINYSGVLLLAWSFMQVMVVLFLDGRYPAFMVQIQDLIAARTLFIRNRVTGFAYEPSWLAHQLNIVYLPLWLAATLNRYSAHRFRIWGITAENILLLAGAAILVSSLSRIGMLAFALVILYLILKGTAGLARRLHSRLPGRLQAQAFLPGMLRFGISAGLFLLVLAGSAGALVGLAFLLSLYDERLLNLFNPNLVFAGSIYSITNYLAFAERVIYWATGWEIFNDYPFLGVGLGNAGFFFPQKMPAFGWALWETTRLFFRLSQLPNIKSMWVRILAETGIIGFSFFGTWYYMLLRSARHVPRAAGRLLKTGALAGQLTLIAFFVEGFSIDSFALPYFWLAAGMLTATIHLIQKEIAVSQTSPPADSQIR